MGYCPRGGNLPTREVKELQPLYLHNLPGGAGSYSSSAGCLGPTPAPDGAPPSN